MMRRTIPAESAAVAALAVLLYGRTLAPGVGAGDSGELLLAASTLGVPHPPGYPLWTLLAGIAAAVPLGSLPWRVNAVSALLAAAAAGLLWALARRAGLGRFGAAVATSLYAASIPVWRTAVEAEVYGLAAVAFLALSHFAWSARAGRTSGPRADALFFFSCGLAYLAHQTLAAPALVLGAWVLRRRFAWTRVASAAGWIIVGLTPALFVVWRAEVAGFAWRARTPLAALWDVVSRGSYGAVAQHPLRIDLIAGDLFGMAMVVFSGIGWAGAALLAVGAVIRLRSRRGRAARALFAPTLAALAIPVGLATIVAFAPDAEHFAQVEPFLLPVLAVAALGAGASAAGVSRLRWPRLAAAAISLAVAAGTASHFSFCDRSAFRLPERYARDILSAVPPGATLVVDGDNETFLIAYLLRHGGERPDLAIRHRRGYVFGDGYGLADLPRARWVERAHAVDLAEMSAPGSAPALWFTTPPADLEAAGVAFASNGLVARASAPGSPAPAPWRVPAAWPRSSSLLGGHAERYDYVTRKLAIGYSEAAARSAWGRGDAAMALDWYEDAARVGFDMPEAQWNVAEAAAAAGRPERALDALLAARSLAPHRAESAARLALFLSAAGRHADAARWFERAFRDEPSRALAADAARAWTMAGDAARAGVWRERAAAEEGVS